MEAHVLLRRAHRVVAVLFLATILPAAVASGGTGDPSPVVYLPLFPLLGLTITGTYLLARPWVRRLRAR